jgi:hypothetical protein
METKIIGKTYTIYDRIMQVVFKNLKIWNCIDIFLYLSNISCLKL